MKLPKLVIKFNQLGIKPHYQLWEVFLTRKINFITVIGSFNVILSAIIFPLFNLTALHPLLITTIVLAPLVFLVNNKINYVWGAYGFYLIGIILMLFMSIRLGTESYFLLFYFPITLSVIQLLGRKETVLHMIIILLLFFVSIITIVICYKNNYGKLNLEPSTVSNLQAFNIIISAFTGTAVIIQITLENIKHESLIKSMLKEKEILVAEVFHRVKNNMNIVTSLLNLKKENSNSQEVKDALEDCRNRVFSMALVHQKIFNKNNVSELDFGEYTVDLINEIKKSVDSSDSDKITVKATSMKLPLNYAIPCGLILNELITNSFKYAKMKGKVLEINVELISNDKERKLIVKDNGPGIYNKENQHESTLGMVLIKSLCEQIDAKYKFENNNGLSFTLVF